MSGAFPFDPSARCAGLLLCEAAVAAFFPGVPEVTAGELAGWLAGPDAPVLLDVRAPEEHAVSRIPGARLVPPGTLPDAALTEAERQGGAAIVCACSVGLRSGRMARALLEDGLLRDRVYNLRGGLFRWARLGLPLVDDKGPTRAVHPFDARWGLLLER